MWRIALKMRPDAVAQQRAPFNPDAVPVSPRWRVVQCWNVREEWASRIVKVERKNPRRKRLLLLAPWPVSTDLPIDPAVILQAMLSAMPESEKLRLVREGLA